MERSRECREVTTLLPIAVFKLEYSHPLFAQEDGPCSRNTWRRTWLPGFDEAGRRRRKTKMGDDEEKQPPMTKKIRSLPPDIVVEVGNGEATREFDCYKAALCFASPVFDLMFSNDMVGCK